MKVEKRVKPRKDLTGMKFGRLTVVEQADDIIERKEKKHVAAWLCRCDCGNQVVVRGYALKRGTTTSCGCFHLEDKRKRSKKYNTYDLTTYDYAVGYTTKGEEFWFDKEDYELVKDYMWRFGTGGYLVALPLHTDNYEKYQIQFHRLVMGVLDKDWNDVMVDHIVHNTMSENKYDNRKINLRLVTRSQNNENAHIRSDNTSGVKGVCWHDRQKAWASTIFVNGKTKHLGYFTDFELAVVARKAAERKYFGDYSIDKAEHVLNKRKEEFYE